MKLTRLLFLTLFLTLCGSLSLFGQTSQGLPNFGTFQSVSPIETIDLGSLNVHVDVPIYAKSGRGVSFNYHYTSDNLYWYTIINKLSGLPQWKSGGLVAYETPSLQHVGASSESWQTTACTNGALSDTINGFSYRDTNNTVHTFNLVLNTLGCQHPASGTAYDERGDYLQATVGQDSNGDLLFPVLKVTNIAGQVFDSSIPSTNLTNSTFTDANGNVVTAVPYAFGSVDEYKFTDTLGLTVLDTHVSTEPQTFTYTGEGGSEQVQMHHFSGLTTQTNWSIVCSGAYTQQYSSANGGYLSSIALPDGSSYQFTYEQTPGYSTAYTTGRLASVQLPTGGKASYSYATPGCDGTLTSLTRTDPDGGVWHFTHSASANANHVTWTTVVDPAGNSTSYWFYNNGGNSYEIERVVHTGSSTVLETVITCYNGQTTNCNTAPNAITTVSRRTISITLGSVTRKVDEFYNSYGQLTEQDGYDWGASSPTRKHIISYGTWNGTCNATGVLPGSNIRPVCADVIEDSGNAWKAATLYEYDTVAVQPSNITTQHTSPAPGGSSRGNATEIGRYISGTGNYLWTANTFYDTGNLYQTTDPNGDQYTFTYGDCAGAFLTSVQEPASLSRSMAWDCNGAVPTSATDEAGATTTINHSGEIFWRTSSISDPMGQATTFSYTPTSVESVMNFATSSTVDIIKTVDSLGRPHFTQRREAQGSGTFDSVETDYNNVGEVSRVTQPYGTTTVGGTNSTVAATTYTYDGLGRVGVVTSPSGATKVSTYTNNQVFVQVSPQFGPTGTNTASGYQYDGLGRLTDVCEGNGGQGWGVAPCIVSSYGGYWTHYQYDILGNILTATLNYTSASPQTRTFTYDGLSRLLSEINPETGTTTYVYDTGTKGDLYTVTDNMGQVLTYTYGQMHRLTKVSTGTTCRNFAYDSTNAHTGANNTNGAVSYAYTDDCSGANKTTEEWFGYDADGRTTDFWESTPHSGGQYYVTSQYYPNGQANTIVSSLLPSTITYQLEGEGRIYSAIAGTGTNPLTSTSYDVAGHVTAVNFGSADGDTYTYDAQTGLMKTYTLSVNGASNAGTLTWNTNGTLQQLAINDALNSGGTQTCNYTYDPIGRLSQADCGALWGQTFSYDAYGNLTKNIIAGDGGLAFNPGYNNANQYTMSAAHYDADGRLTNDSLHSYTWSSLFSGPVAIGTNSMTYDAFNRVVEQQNGSAYVEYLYSPFGYRLATMNGQTYASARIPLPAGSAAVYYGANLPHYYNHADWLGSIRVTSTNLRVVSQDESFAPFGEEYAFNSGNSQAGDVFTGQRRNYVNSGLWDFPLREYFGSQGRWMSPDPAGLAAADPTDPQTWNRYAYVGGNPLSNVDPLGLCEGGGTSNFAPHEPGAITANVSAPCPKGQVDEAGTDDAIGNGPSGSGCGFSMGLLSFSFAACPVGRQQRSGWEHIRFQLAANNGTCGITVKCRGIQTDNLGKIGMQHCDAQVTTSSGQVWSLSGGPQPNYMSITALNAWATSPPTEPFTGTTVYQGNSCTAASCMVQSTQAWNQDIVKPEYRPMTGPNSNTWLKGTAAGCGVSLPINTWGSIW